MRTAKQQLVAARKLISKPKSWTQGTYARTGDRLAAEIDGDKAHCWCLIGAIRAVDPDNSEEALDWLRATLRHEYGEFISISHFNDTHSHAEVLRALDLAIASAN